LRPSASHNQLAIHVAQASRPACHHFFGRRGFGPRFPELGNKLNKRAGFFGRANFPSDLFEPLGLAFVLDLRLSLCFSPGFPIGPFTYETFDKSVACQQCPSTRGHHRAEVVVLIRDGPRTMSIREHPPIGTVMLCDFNAGFKIPEMVKRRPCVVISPKIALRPGLCTVVALSTDAPYPIMPYHCQIDLRPELPEPWKSDGVWVKGDMVNAVGFHRLDLIRLGKDFGGKRQYLLTPLSVENIKKIRHCVLTAIGLGTLTKHL
jgi:mRNA interferase MazF